MVTSSRTNARVAVLVLDYTTCGINNVQGMLNFLAARRCVCVFSFCFYAMLAF